MACLFSLTAAACADDASKAEEATEERYEWMCSFAKEYFEDLTLPKYEDMVVSEKDKLMFVQSKYGIARAQDMLDAPAGTQCSAVKELSQVKVFAEKDGYSFVIIMEDVDGTMGWIDSEYLTDSWNYNLSMGRTINGWSYFCEE